MKRGLGMRFTPGTQSLALGVVVLLVAAVFIRFTRDHSQIAAAWPVNAIIVAALLSMPQRHRMSGLASAGAGIFGAELLNGYGLAAGSCLTLANVVEAVVLLYVLTRSEASPNLNAGAINASRNLFVGSIFGSLAGAAIAACALFLFRGLPMVSTFTSWFVADALCLLVFTPPMQSVIEGPRRFGRLTASQIITLILFAACVPLIFFQNVVSLAFLGPALIVLVAFNFEPRGTAFAVLSLFLSGFAAIMLGRTFPALRDGTTTQHLYYLQAFTLLCGIVGNFTSSVLAERRRFLLDAQRARDAAQKAEALATRLMGEINHRSMNLLAVVQSIATLTASEGDPKRFRAQLTERLRGLGASQDLIIKRNWQAVGLRELVEAQLQFVGVGGGERVTISGEDILITPSAAQVIGMALHELATNAIKHGALSNASGRIHVRWSRTGEPRTTFDMEWVEEGGPPIGKPNAPGFGTTVVEDMASVGSSGEAKLEFTPEGIRWRLRAPEFEIAFSPHRVDGGLAFADTRYVEERR